MKGKNIGCNVRSIIDLIDYRDAKNDIPGSIVLLDIEKAFDSVEHNYYICIRFICLSHRPYTPFSHSMTSIRPVGRIHSEEWA